MFGKRYPLRSFQKSPSDFSLQKQDTILTTLQYIFKPSSVDIGRCGTLAISESNEVHIALPILDVDGDAENFKGIATKPLNECILSFHGDHFLVEKVSSTITNIRHSRNESTFSLKDSTIGDARKYHEKTLQLRAGPRPLKKRKVSKVENSRKSVAGSIVASNPVEEGVNVDADICSGSGNISSGSTIRTEHAVG